MIYPGQPRITGAVELAAYLREQITSGKIRPDQRIPSEKDLVQMYGLARGTVNKAVHMLRTEGLVQHVRGYGVVVRRRPPLEPYPVPPGTVIRCRPPRDEDYDRWGGIPDGVHMLEIIPPDGAGDDLPDAIPGDRFEVHATSA